MSKLEELIKELCPNGVEYKRVKDFFIRLKGTPITAGKMKEIEDINGEIRVFAGGKTVINAKEKDIPNVNITKVPAVLVQSRGVIDFIYYDKPFTFKNEMWAYTSGNVTTVKYLYYVLKNAVNYFREAASGMGSLPQISLTITEEFKIPLPPLAVQREIVHILDKFTLLSQELEDKLAAELAARRVQYEYYRDKLLNLTKQEYSIYAQIYLGDICQIYDGTHQTPKYTDFGVKFVSVENIENLYASQKYISNEDYETNYKIKPACGDILMTRIGVIGKCAVVDRDEPLAYYVSLALLKPNYQKVSSKYLKYYLESSIGKRGLRKLTLVNAVPIKVNMGDIKKVKISLPPLDVQERIVKVLDNFDAICSDLGIGLPAEIEKRQQQYEFYRDKLLTFDIESATILTDRQTDRQG